GPSAELSTYTRGEQTYYSLSVNVPAEAATAGPRDVVILLDTSASQTGAYREMALAAVDACLAKLDANDRVRLMAVDLDARSMSDKFLAVGSAARKNPPK